MQRRYWLLQRPSVTKRIGNLTHKEAFRKEKCHIFWWMVLILEWTNLNLKVLPKLYLQSVCWNSISSFSCWIRQNHCNLNRGIWVSREVGVAAAITSEILTCRLWSPSSKVLWCRFFSETNSPPYHFSMNSSHERKVSREVWFEIDTTS